MWHFKGCFGARMVQGSAVGGAQCSCPCPLCSLPCPPHVSPCPSRVPRAGGSLETAPGVQGQPQPPVVAGFVWEQSSHIRNFRRRNPTFGTRSLSARAGLCRGPRQPGDNETAIN